MHVFCRSQMIAFASNFALLLWWLVEHKETVENANATQPPLEFLDPHCKYTSASGLAWAFLLMNLTNEGLASVNFILSKYLVWYTRESHNLYIVPICTNCTKKDRFSQLFALWTLCHGRSAASEQCSTCNRLSKSVHCPPRLKQTRRNRRHPSSSMAEPHHLQILYIPHYTVYNILSMAACCPPLILAQTIARRQSDSGLNPARLRFAMTSLETSYPFAW